MNYTIYNNNTGKILKNISCPAKLLSAQYDKSNNGVLEGTFDCERFYIDNKKITPRPELSISCGDLLIADGVSELAITALPLPSTLTYSGPGFEIKQEITENSVELTTTVVGEHKIKIEAWPYLDWEATFNAY